MSYHEIPLGVEYESAQGEELLLGHGPGLHVRHERPDLLHRRGINDLALRSVHHHFYRLLLITIQIRSIWKCIKLEYLRTTSPAYDTLIRILNDR